MAMLGGSDTTEATAAGLDALLSLNLPDIPDEACAPAMQRNRLNAAIQRLAFNDEGTWRTFKNSTEQRRSDPLSE
jgi:hypothetical protein